MNATPKIPEGYVLDSRGRLVHESTVQDIDKLRDQTIEKIMFCAREMSMALAQIKKEMMADIATFADISAERYGVRWGGQKGNITLTTFDGLKRVIFSQPESVSFGEGLQAARALIDECLDSWTAGASGQHELRAIIDGAFAANKLGQIDAQRVLSLRRYNIEDERWQKAMVAIMESIVVTGKRAYVRCYYRHTFDGEWLPVPLDIAAL